VLAFAFLHRVYLMIVVSFKTNTQFYAAPAAVTAPFHPENWAEAWRLVTPTVAKQRVRVHGRTVLILSFGLCAAYFFARQRMPLSGFFWNAILVLMMMPMIANLVPLFRLLRDMNLLNTLAALILVGAASGPGLRHLRAAEFRWRTSPGTCMRRPRSTGPAISSS